MTNMETMMRVTWEDMERPQSSGLQIDEEERTVACECCAAPFVYGVWRNLWSGMPAPTKCRACVKAEWESHPLRRNG